MSSFDIAIIGAGIAGVSAAWRLSETHKVLLIEQEYQPGHHATGRSVAILSQTYGAPSVRALTAASRDFLDHPPGGFSEYPLLSDRGLMFVCQAGQEHLLDEHRKKAAVVDVSVEPLSAAQVHEKLPLFRSDWVAAGLYEPGAKDIDVGALQQGFLRAAKANGVTVATDAQLTGLSREGRNWRLSTRAGDYVAAVIVNAAGAWCDEIAAMAELPPIGITPLARTAVTFDPNVREVSRHWPMAIAADHSFYFKPEGHHILASLSDEQPAVPCDIQPDELHIAELINRLEQATVMAPRRLASRWAGLRSFVADRNLVCGPDPLEPSFVWLAGQGGFGIQTAPAAADLVAAMIRRTAIPVALENHGFLVKDVLPDRLPTP